MNEWLTWISMGGYARYVWPAYGIVIGVLGLYIWQLQRQATRGRRQLIQWLKQQSR